MPAIDFTFSGSSREIIINPGVTSVDVQDMYSRWKDWTTISDNTKWYGAFRTFGGDATIPGQFAPRYYFLINNWVVKVNNNEEVDFGVNLYNDNLTGSTFIVGSGSSVTSRNSDAVVVDDPIAQTIEYAGQVNVNPKIGVSGVTYPIGTLGLPVNNMVDAESIANTRGIFNYHIYGEVTGDVNLHNSTVIGGNISDKFNFVQGFNYSGTTFKQIVLDGVQIGSIGADNCVIEDGYSGMSGTFNHCGLRGKVYFQSNIDSNFIDGVSQIPGNNSPEFYLGLDIDLSIRKYSGGLSFYNIDSGSTITAEFMAGDCKILSGNTAGELELRGIAKLTNQGSGTTIGTDGLIIPIDVQQGININTELLKNN